MLLDQLQSDVTVAMKARDEVRISTLRFLLGAVFNLQIEKCPPASGKVLEDADVLGVIAKQAKTHRESIEMFEKGGRQDLVEREKAELAILESYLPRQMSESEVRAKIEEIKKKNSGVDFGTMMKLSMAEFKGKIDGAVVSRIVAEIRNV